MIRRMLTVALTVVLVVMSLPASLFAEQAAPAKSEQPERAQLAGTVQGLDGTSGVLVNGDLPQPAHHLDLQSAVRRIVLDAQSPRPQTLLQSTGGGGLFEVRGKKLLIYLAAIGGIAYTMYALEGISPKPSSTNEK